MLVSHYGVHRGEGGIAFLLQQRSHQTLLERAIPCPFQISNARWRCNHNIDLSERNKEDLPDDPLVELMKPLPAPAGEAKVHWFKDPKGELTATLFNLSRMSWPVKAIVRPGWSIDLTPQAESAFNIEMMTTNVQPMVLTGVDGRLARKLPRLVEIATASQRRMILTGPHMPLPRGIERMETELHGSELGDVNWEGVGAQILYEHMEKGW